MTDGNKAGARIEVRDLTKKFGSFTAVDNLSFSVEPGRITGFLGPNGAGKTTTLRMLLGLVRPTSGSATIGGERYSEIRTPQLVVGSALEATNFHPGRSGRNHLRVLADTAGLDSKRVDEMLELVGIPAAARQRAGGYSMGMRQRLGLAAALLGDPQVLLLDEPANGLDPEGIRWLRMLLRHLSGQGKTILISSHMLSEVEQTVDDVVIIANGRFIQQGSVANLHGEKRAIVRTTESALLVNALVVAGVRAHATDYTTLEAYGDDLARVGDIALAAGLPIHELRAYQTDLEELFFELTEAPENQNRNVARGSGSPGPTGAAVRDSQAAIPAAPSEGARL
jgi:ABC-2 type transport system ATP-binding protein